MSDYARISDGIVVEIIPPHPSGLPFEQCWPADFVAACVAVPEGEVVEAGYLWDGSAFSPPPPPELPPVDAPQSVRAWAAKAVLHQHGLLDEAEAAASAASDAWPFRFAGAPDWTRDDCLQLGVDGMGLTEEQVDAMLLEAAALA
jgi:hypothetical protein